MFRVTEVLLVLIMIVWGMVLFDIGSISLRISQFFIFLEEMRRP
ncbi:hypothetical protein M2403_001788 [Rahnella sp. BIGb0603]|jgi:hypothetical protein|nr:MULTISPECIES: hypothetical protein [Rahnella]MCS3423187.1 hypothetical protein [Rahnella sp. BIGb0603]MDF1894278.1 hypothetical protein [Rahnella contaminans]